MAIVALVQLDPPLQDFLASDLARLNEVQILKISQAEDLLERLRGDPGAIDVVVVGVAVAEPIRLLQRLFPLGRDMAVLLLANPPDLAALGQAVQFSPFATRQTRCMTSEAGESLCQALRQAIQRTNQRRSYAQTMEALQQRVGLDAPPPLPQGVVYLDQILERAPVGIAVVDQAGRIALCNRALQALLRQDERALLGRRLIEFFLEPNRPEMQEWINTMLSGTDSSAAQTFETIQDRRLMVEMTGAAIETTSHDSALLLLMQDVTEQYRAKAEISELNRSLQRQVRQHEQTLHELSKTQSALQDKIADLEAFHDAVVDRELQMIELEKTVAGLRAELQQRQAGLPPNAASQPDTSGRVGYRGERHDKG